MPICRYLASRGAILRNKSHFPLRNKVCFTNLVIGIFRWDTLRRREERKDNLGCAHAVNVWWDPQTSFPATCEPQIAQSLRSEIRERKKKSLISNLRVNSTSTKLGVKGDPWVNGEGRFQSPATGKEIGQIDPTRQAESLKHVNHLSVSCFWRLTLPIFARERFRDQYKAITWAS